MVESKVRNTVIYVEQVVNSKSGQPIISNRKQCLRGGWRCIKDEGILRKTERIYKRGVKA